MRVLKFGGTSLENAGRIRRVAEIVARAAASERILVVVSAMAEVTNTLVDLVEQALRGDAATGPRLDQLQRRHQNCLRSLAGPGLSAPVEVQIFREFEKIGQLVEGVRLLKECSPAIRDVIVSAGERLSAPLLAACLQEMGLQSEVVVATELIATDSSFGEAVVDFGRTEVLSRQRLGSLPANLVPVVTGFIGADSQGRTTTLGRGGSDYSASILGAVLGATCVEIWTDVDGVLTAPPKMIPEAVNLPVISYQEAAELAYFGAKVLHSKTIHPVAERNIPLVIRNTLNVESPGTMVTAEAPATENGIRAVSIIEEGVLFSIQQEGAANTHDLARQIFQVLSELRMEVPYVGTAQGSQTITLVTRSAQASQVQLALEQEFAEGITSGSPFRINRQEGVGVIAVVGAGLKDQPASIGRLMDAMRRRHIPVLGVAGGLSSCTTSFIVPTREIPRAVTVIHALSVLHQNRYHLVLTGARTPAGRAFLSQLARRQAAFLESAGIELKLTGLAHDQKLAWLNEGLPLDDPDALLANGTAFSGEELLAKIENSRLEHMILVDCSSGDLLASCYPALLQAGCGIITCNRIGSNGLWKNHSQFKELSRRCGVPYRYGATLGPARQLLRTVWELCQSGHRLSLLEASLSSALSFVFEQINGGVRFSRAVEQAVSQGYCPREAGPELSGEEAARRCQVILREAGILLESKDIVIESPFLAFRKENGPAAAAMEPSELDASWQERAALARSRGKKLVHLACYDGRRLTVRVEAAAIDSPCGRLREGENVVVLGTDLNQAIPFTLTFPGITPETVASAILAEILEAVRQFT